MADAFKALGRKSLLTEQELADPRSILETFERVGRLVGKRMNWEFRDEARKGDHICYISDLRKLRSHFPNWKLTFSLDRILEEIVASEQQHVRTAGSS